MTFNLAVALEHLALALALLGDVTFAGYAGVRLQVEGYAHGFTEATTHGRLTALLASASR